MVKKIKCDYFVQANSKFLLDISICSINYNLKFTSYTWYQITNWCMSTNCLGFNLNGSVCIKLLLPIRLFLVILWPWPWITLVIFLFSWWSVNQVVRFCFKAQFVSCLQRIQSRFLTMWQYQHLPLIMVINYTNLCDPGAYSSLCILPTLSYYVTIQLWPVTTDLEKH